MKISVLLCALALPAMTKDKQFRELRRWLRRDFPNHEIILVHPEEKVVGSRYLHTPLEFRGLRVYLVRSA